jgi:hypothetical protein
VYRFDGANWVEEAKLVPSDSAAGDWFHKPAISGDRILVSSQYTGGIGGAYVFAFDGASWTEEAKLVPSDGAAEDRFGTGVSLYGDVAVIGALGDDDLGSASGSAYVFRFDGIDWVEEAKLTASDGAAGDNFGQQVSVHGEVIVVGARYDDDTGSAYVFRFDGANWVEEAKLTAWDACSNCEFGSAVSVSGEVVFIGANAFNASRRGSAHVYRGLGDCNTNGVIDLCETTGGTSPDCQPNQIPDDCDIRDGTSLDVDSDGIPDECTNGGGGICDPPVGGGEPIPCTTNGDCAGFGPEVCANGFCAYPTPTPCTTHSDCEGIGTGHCLYSEWYCEDQDYHYCPMGTDEGEWNNYPNGCGFPQDVYNGGCHADGDPVFSSITCGETVCGTSMMVVYSGSQRRDTDWYELVITEPTKVTIRGTAEFDWAIGLAHNHGDENCDDLGESLFWDGHWGHDDACVQVQTDACLHPGTWWIVAVPLWGSSIPCLDYVLTVECESPCSVPCCVGNDVCVETDHDTCEVSGGTLLPFETCSYPGVDCTYGCPGTEFPCNAEQVVDNTVNSDTAKPSMSCATGDSIGLFWWWFTAESDSVQISTCNSNPGLGGDSVFALYEGDCFNTLTEIDCSEDNDCGQGNWLGITCTTGLTTGDTYYIQFASWDATSQGTYLVQVECPCPEYAAAACCLSDGTCATATVTQCESVSGQYQGAGSACAGDLDSNGIDDLCEPGACCTGGTQCAETSQTLCTLVGGLEWITAATCDPNPCEGACCRKTGFPPQWQCTDIASGACVGTWFEGEECSLFDCADCIALDVRSYKTHGPAGELSLAMGASDGIEPRSGGITELEIDVLDGSTFAGGVTVTCSGAGDVSGFVSGTSDVGNTVTVTFDPALPDQDACVVDLDCGGSACVRSCEGDLNRSGDTTAADSLQAKIRFGEAATTANCEWDFDLSGSISASDALQIKIRFGFTAPTCP